jgi:hypothetical protein
MRALSSIFAAALFILSGSAVAVPITYNLDSGPLSTHPGIPSGVTSIHGMFTVDLPASNTDATIQFPVSQYSFFDGVTTFASGGEYVVEVAHFLTDALGAITEFELRILWDGFNAAAHPVTPGMAHLLYVTNIPSIIESIGLTGDIYFVESYCVEFRSDGTCSVSTGTSSQLGSLVRAASVAEPGGLTLLGTGAGIWLLLRNRRFRRT